MENMSRCLSNEDTATSMYLSFDAESTMSTACYKTLDAMTDISALSTIDLDKSSNDYKTTNEHLNGTLEADNVSQIKSPLKTVKKIDVLVEKKTHTPLRALPKNIMKEYRALSSTPSKEQLLKTVDVTRGSDATRCIDLGLAFIGVEDEKPAYFPPPNVIMQSEENKENAQPEIEEVSTLSTCSSVEVTTTVIERKMTSSVSMVGSITEEEGFIEDVIMVKSTEVVDNPVEEMTKPITSTEKDLAQNTRDSPEKMAGENEAYAKLSVDITPKAEEVKNVQYMATITESPEKSTENATVAMDFEEYKIIEKVRAIGKPKITAPSHNLRRSICEPNLQTNKPSRISNSADMKRKSLLPTSKKSNLAINAEIEIPLLMSKMLKISNAAMEETDKKVDDGSVANYQKKSLTNEHKHSVVASMKTRSSLIPSAAGDKRPFSFAQRMSVVVKTTLNSPARKIARKSLIGGVTTSLPRRSILPQKMVASESSYTKKTEIQTRKSMLPKTSAAVSLNTKTNAQRHSLMPSTTKMAEKTKISGVLNKQELVYTCNFCKEKFRIKSLLEAHKRSHESDNITPAFVKKPTVIQQTSSVSLLNHANQCKYCDKKFALIKALHIHLLQNCSKIPPSEKRKLQYTDLNHVGKAQLPNVFNNHQYNASSVDSSVSATPRNLQKYTLNTLNNPKRTIETTTEIKDIVATSDGNNLALTQASAQKVKKLSAHAGVYRTPSKSVPCHLCKTTFKSILDYTNHNLTVHGKDNRGKKN